MQKKQIVFLLLLSLSTQLSAMTMPLVIVQPPQQAPEKSWQDRLYEKIMSSPSALKEIKENLPYYTRMIEEDIEILEILQKFQDKTQNKDVYKGLKKIGAGILCFLGTMKIAASPTSNDPVTEGYYTASFSLLFAAGFISGVWGAMDVIIACQYKKQINDQLEKDKRIFKLLKNIPLEVQ